MKISQKDLELKVLKCIISIDSAISYACEKNIQSCHFLTKNPGSDKSILGKIYEMCLKYHHDHGCKLTQTVLLSMLNKKTTNDNTIKKFLSMWYEIEEEESTIDDLPELISVMKDRYCLEAFKECIDKNTQFAQNDQINEMIAAMQDYTNLMLSEQDDFAKEKESFSLSSEYFLNEYNTRIENSESFAGIYCGLSQIDTKTFGFSPSQLIVVLAPSSGGKSMHMLNWAHHAYSVQKKNVLYFSFEMDSWLCSIRHISLAAEIDYNRIKGGNLTQKDKAKIAESLDLNNDKCYFHYEVSIDDPTPEYIEQKIKEITKSKGKPDLVVVDYIGNMTTRTTSSSAKNYEKHGDAAEGLFKLAKRYNIPILTAQQLGKETIKENQKNKDSGKNISFNQVASYGDQRLMHLATYVIGLEPVKDENLCYVHPVKMRDAWFDPFPVAIVPEWNKVEERLEMENKIEQNVTSLITKSFIDDVDVDLSWQ